MKKGIGLLIATLVACLCADAFSRMGQITERARPFELDIDTLELVSDSEEYDVVTALIDSLYGFPDHEKYFHCISISRATLFKPTALKDSAFLHETFAWLDMQIPMDCLENLVVANRNQFRWDARFSTSIPYRWQDYGHPDSEKCTLTTLSISRIGFDRDRSRAIALLSRKYSHKGADAVVYFCKMQEHWRVVKVRTYSDSD